MIKLQRQAAPASSRFAKVCSRSPCIFCISRIGSAPFPRRRSPPDAAARMPAHPAGPAAARRGDRGKGVPAPLKSGSAAGKALGRQPPVQLPDVGQQRLANLAGAGKQAPRLDARQRGRALTDQYFFSHSLSPPAVVLCINIAPFPWLISQLVSSNRHALGWGRDTACSFPAPIPYDLFSSSRSVIFRRLMPSVDPLCSSAEVVGGSTPATPSAISVRLKPTMKR